MAERLISWIFSLLGITIFVAAVGAIIFGVLAATGGGAANECTPDKPDAAGVIVKRGVTRNSDLSEKWQLAWNDFEAALDAGQSRTITFNESDVSSRADTYLQEKNAPVENVTICFHEGDAEASAKVDVPGLGDIPILGGLFNTNARIRGTMDLSGDHPRITITELEAGNLPGFASDQIKGGIEDIVNDRLDDLNIKHEYGVTFREAEVQISGAP